MASDRERRAQTVRAGSLASLALAVVVLLVLSLADRPFLALWGPGFAAVAILVFESWMLWAARSERIQGTRMLALYSATAAVVILVVPWLLGENARWTWITSTLGLLLVLVDVAEAFVAAGDKRRATFGPPPV